LLHNQVTLELRTELKNTKSDLEKVKSELSDTKAELLMERRSRLRVEGELSHLEGRVRACRNCRSR